MLEERPTGHLTEAEIKAATAPFLGIIQQTPPLFSAVKIDGQRAYELARQGQSAEIKPKTVTIKAFELTGIAGSDVDFRVVCSKGTYIRSLARDLGEALGCGAHLIKLVRTRIGEYRLEDALTLTDVQALRPPQPAEKTTDNQRQHSARRPLKVRVGLEFYAAQQAAAAPNSATVEQTPPASSISEINKVNDL